MTYEEALSYIHETNRFGCKLGLENIQYLLGEMGNPQEKLKFIHVAGTNGKGSITAMTVSVLQQAGFKAGMYTSPYIEEFTERIQINGEQIPRIELARITSSVQACIQRMVERGETHPTEFEIVTAIALQYYTEQQCDIVVLEVGMGGRFDATNIIPCPLVSVITSISMDHMEYLGDTIGKIAFEKCGIIKPQGRVVVYPYQDTSVLEVIQQRVVEEKAQLFHVETEGIQVISDTLEGISFEMKPYGRLHIPLLGRHQVFNAVTAIKVIEVLQEYCGISIDQDDIRKGLKDVQWPGRLEMIGTSPLFIIDGGHNEAGIQALREALQHYLTHIPITLIMGMMKDKAVEACVEMMAPVAEKIVAVMPDSPRGLPAKEMVSIMKKYSKHVLEADSIQEAVEIALEHTPVEGAICCCGSLYIIGHVRKYMKDKYLY